MLKYIHPQLHDLALPIDSLNEDPSNANKHGDRNLAAIAESFKRFGQRKPLVVRREGMIVEAGNGTLAALRRAGWTHLACVVCDDDEQTAMAYGLADNQSARLAEWDFDNLQANVEALLGDGYDVGGLGWSGDELADIMSGKAQELAESLTPQNDAPRPGDGSSADGENEDYENLSGEDEGSNRPRATAPLLHWGKRRVYITEAEASALEQSYLAHVEKLGSPYGFITALLEGRRGSTDT